MAENDIDAVINRHASRLLQIPGVIGVGAGKGSTGSVIAIYLNGQQDPLPQDLPTEIEGYPVQLNTESGPFRKL